MYYATICAIAKDEEPFIKEWAEYHLSVGFEHIYVYDNNSAVPISKTLSEHMDAGLVTVIDFPSNTDQQRAAYMDCLLQYGNKSRWMAFIDIDEFIVPKSKNDIRDILDGYTEYGGLAIHWKMFGSQGRKTRPAGGVINNYDKVVAFDSHIKSIVQPARVDRVYTPHSFGYKNGYFCVNEDYVPVASFQSYHVSKTVQVNHYYYKSLEDFEEKIKRGCATGPDRNAEAAFADFAQQESACGELDQTIQKLESQKKASMSALSDVVLYLNDCNKTSDEFEKMLTDCLAINKTALAVGQLHKYLRYYDTPVSWLLAAKIYLLVGEHATSLQYLQKLLADVNNPLRSFAYDCLVEYYRCMADDDTADRLKKSLA